MSYEYDDDPMTATADRFADLDTEGEVGNTSLVVREAGQNNYHELVRLAQELPARDEVRLIREARKIGTLLAEDAYYSFPVGAERVEGPTIDLMDALASAWGRIVTRVQIMGQPRADRVHLKGVVIDLLTITAVERDQVGHLSEAPGKFAKSPEQVARWETMQIQSVGSKAVRNAIEHALPKWFTRAAVKAAQVAVADDLLLVREQDGSGKWVTVKDDKGRPLRRDLPAARGYIGSELAKLAGLTKAELEGWLGMPSELWTVEELRELRTLYADLKGGRIAVEQVRAHAGEAASTERVQAKKDRLGLDPTPAPAAAATTPSSPAPSTTPAGLTGGSSGAGSTSTSSPPASGGSPAASGVDQVDPDQEERTRLIGELKHLAADLPEATRDSLRAQHDLRKISPTAANLGKLRLLVEATKRAVADRVAKAGIEVPDPWTGPLDAGVLADRLRAELPLIGGSARALMDRAGAPSLDGAPEPALRRLLVLVEAYLDEHPPEPVEWVDSGVPLEPALSISIEDWCADLSDGLICRAAHEAGLVVTVAGPELPEESEGAARRRFLSRLKALGEGR